MWKEFKYAKTGGRFAVDMDKVSMVSKSSDGYAVLFVDGSDEGIETDTDYDDFASHELGIEP